MSQNVTDSNGKISVKERIAYGFGDFSSNIMYSAMSAFLMFYYTDVVGVGAAAVGVIMMCSRLFDGVSDLIMGIIIDRTNSKYGKARVWILRLVIPYAIGTVLLFAVPTGWTQTAKLIYIFFSYNLAFTVLSVCNTDSPDDTESVRKIRPQYIPYDPCNIRNVIH